MERYEGFSSIIDDNSSVPVGPVGAGGRGLVPRDFSAQPFRSIAPPSTIPLIPRAEWPDRIRTMERAKSRLSDIRNDMGPGGTRIPSLNQGQWGYCWGHGPVAAATLVRARQGQPYLPFSAFGVAYTIKQGRDEGAWGALALDFMRERGIPLEIGPLAWPRFEKRMRSQNDPMWQEAAKYKVTEGWADLTNPVYDRDMNFDQVMSCLLNNQPVVADFNWWGHCVVLMDPVLINATTFGIRLWNSWGDEWEQAGTQVITGQKMYPDNAVALADILLAA